MQTPTLVELVAVEIMSHLEKHPGAGDTARGITQWWLPATRLRVDPATVEAALTQLVDQGVMRRSVLPTGERFYCGAAGGRNGQ